MEKFKTVLDIHNNTVTNTIREHMFLENIKPSVDLSKKSWNLIKVLKTETGNVPWLISYDDQFYVAIQSNNRRYGSEGVSFYPSNKKGKYEISLKNEIVRLKGYLDLEAACDEFTNRLYQEKLKEPINI